MEGGPMNLETQPEGEPTIRISGRTRRPCKNKYR